MKTVLHVICCAFVLSLCGGYEVPEESVMEELFYEYNNEARPASASDPVVKVSHQLSLTRIISLHDDLLVIDTWQAITWRDLRLAWDRTYYEDVDSLNLNPSKIWKPDIVNFDNAGGNSGLIYTDLPVTVYHDGEVVYIPPTRLTTQCKPSGDVYHCIWTFGSWTHNIKKMDLNNTQGAIDMSEYEENSRIAIIDSSVRRSLKKYACCPDRYAIVRYNITIRWKDPFRYREMEPMQMPKMASNINSKKDLQNDEQVESAQAQEISGDVLVNATDSSEDSEKGEVGETLASEREETPPADSDPDTEGENVNPDETNEYDDTTVSASAAEDQNKETTPKQNEEQEANAENGKGDNKESSPTDKETDSPADKQTDSPADKQTDSPADRQTDSPADKSTTTESFSWFG